MADNPTEKQGRGRPTKYSEACLDAVMQVGEEGGCVAEMAVACGVTISTLYNWADEHPVFLETFTRAQEVAEAFHAKRVRNGLALTPSEFQGPANLKYMAQRFSDRWSDKARVELSGANGGPIVQEIRRTIVDPRNSDA